MWVTTSFELRMQSKTTHFSLTYSFACKVAAGVEYHFFELRMLPKNSISFLLTCCFADKAAAAAAAAAAVGTTSLELRVLLKNGPSASSHHATSPLQQKATR